MLPEQVPGPPRAQVPAAIAENGAHSVQFYHSDTFLAELVATFLASGIKAGEVAVAIVTQAHAALLPGALTSHGVDVQDAVAQGRFILLDAEETLATFMVGQRPDWHRFSARIEAVLSPALRAAPARKVRAYGEMVDVLWRAGNAEGALLLEELWNELQRVHAFSLLCAYALASFYKEGSGLERICRAHNHLLPEEPKNGPPTGIDGSRLPPTREERVHPPEIERALRAALVQRHMVEEELRRSRRELKDFVDNGALGLHWVGPDGRILWANRAELELLGYSAAEYIGQRISDFHVDPAVIEDILRRLKEGEVLHDVEARLRAKDGSIKTVLITSNAFEEHGQFIHTRCFTRDITERKSLEDARAQSVRRTEQLQAITGAIADAVTAAQVYEAVVDRVANALCASSSALWLRAESGEAVLARSVGYSEASRARLSTLPVNSRAGLPAMDALLSGRPLFIGSQQELLRAYPHLATMVTPGRAYRIACLPIVVNGSALGVLAFTFEGAEEQDEEQRSFLEVVAKYSGQALARLCLLEAERRHRAAAEAAAARLALLGRASKVFSEAGPELQPVLDAIVREVCHEEAEASGVLLVEPDQSLRLAAVHHRRPEALAFVRTLLEANRPRVGEGLTGRVAATGQPVLIERMELSGASGALAEFARQVRPGSVVAVPLVSGGRVIGVLSAMRQEGDRPFAQEDLRLVQELADRAANAIERGRLHEESQRARIRAELLYGLAGAAIQAQRVEEVFEAALDAIEQGLGVSRSAILTFDADEVMRFRAWRGLSDGYRQAVEGHSPWSRGVVAPEPIFVCDAEVEQSLKAYRELFERERIQSLGFIPLVAEGRLVGKFMIYDAHPRSFAPHEVALAKAMATQVATALARFAALSELQRSVRFNEMFTAILGHDLRNPLGGILTAAQLALKKDGGDRLAKPLLRIISSGERMARMIDQLLDFTRVRVGGGIPLRPAHTDLEALVRQVMDELSDANPDWNLHLERRGETSGHWDADRLSQVFSNLIGNAVRHGVPPDVRVTLDGGSKERLTATVHNLGSIPVQVLPRLFEPMAGGLAPREKSNGLGLGLFITRQIVQAHGGTLRVESSEESGTSLLVSLPRVTAPAEGPTYA